MDSYQRVTVIMTMNVNIHIRKLFNLNVWKWYGRLIDMLLS
jgi:hypothetical protein